MVAIRGLSQNFRVAVDPTLRALDEAMSALSCARMIALLPSSSTSIVSAKGTMSTHTCGGFLVLSHDDSAWHGDHLFAVSKPVAGAEMVSLSGDFVTKVFEGPYSKAREWSKQMTRGRAARPHTRDAVLLLHDVPDVREAIWQELCGRRRESEVSHTLVRGSKISQGHRILSGHSSPSRLRVSPIG